MVVHVDRLKPCHGVQQEKWEWRKPSDPQVTGGTEENENETDERQEEKEPSNRPTNEFVVSEVFPKSPETEENSNPLDSHEPSLTESGDSISSQDDKNKGVEENNALKRNTRYPLRTRARPKYLNQYHI